MIYAHEEIINMAISSDSEIRVKCAKIIGETQNQQAIAILFRLLSDSELSVVNQSVKALIEINNEYVVEECIQKMDDENYAVATGCQKVLYEIGHQYYKKIVPFRNDTNANTRKFAVEIIAGSAHKEATNYLIEALEDEDMNVSAEAAIALGKKGESKNIEPIKKLLNKSTWQACCAVNALSKIGDNNTLKDILQLDIRKDASLAYTVITALKSFPSMQSVDYLISQFDQAPENLKILITETLNAIVVHNNQEALEKIARHITEEQLSEYLKKNNGNKNTFIQLAGKLKYKGIIIDLLNLVHNESHDLVEEIETSLHYISKSGSDTFVKILNDDSLSEEAISLALDVLKNPDEPFCFSDFYPVFKKQNKRIKRKILDLAISGSIKVSSLYFDDLLKQEACLDKAICIVGKYGSPKDEKYVYPFLQNPNNDLRNEAAKALSILNPDYLTDLTAKMLTSAQEKERLTGILLLNKVTIEQYVTQLEKLFDSSEYLKEHIIIKIVESGAQSGRIMLEKALYDADDKIRLIALKNFPFKRKQNDIELLKLIVLNENNEWNLYTAVKKAAELKAKDLTDVIEEKCRDKTDVLTTAFIDYISECKDSSYIETLKKYSFSNNDLIRDAAVKALNQTLKKNKNA